MKLILTLAFITTINFVSLAQDTPTTEIKAQAQTFSYAYITIQGKGFSSKLKVEVDLGDTPEQIKSGKEYSEILTNKKSYTAVLNYMSERQFELVTTRDETLLTKAQALPMESSS